MIRKIEDDEKLANQLSNQLNEDDEDCAYRLQMELDEKLARE